jgi:hypothetical protein
MSNTPSSCRVTSILPSREKVVCQQGPPSPGNVTMGRPLSKSQIFKDSCAALPTARRRPSGEKATECAARSKPVNGACSSSLGTSHRRTSPELKGIASCLRMFVRLE